MKTQLHTKNLDWKDKEKELISRLEWFSKEQISLYNWVNKYKFTHFLTISLEKPISVDKWKKTITRNIFKHLRKWYKFTSLMFFSNQDRNRGLEGEYDHVHILLTFPWRDKWPNFTYDIKRFTYHIGEFDIQEIYWQEGLVYYLISKNTDLKGGKYDIEKYRPKLLVELSKEVT